MLHLRIQLLLLIPASLYKYLLYIYLDFFFFKKEVLSSLLYCFVYEDTISLKYHTCDTAVVVLFNISGGGVSSTS